MGENNRIRAVKIKLHPPCHNRNSAPKLKAFVYCINLQRNIAANRISFSLENETLFPQKINRPIKRYLPAERSKPRKGDKKKPPLKSSFRYESYPRGQGGWEFVATLLRESLRWLKTFLVGKKFYVQSLAFTFKLSSCVLIFSKFWFFEFISFSFIFFFGNPHSSRSRLPRTILSQACYLNLSAYSDQ